MKIFELTVKELIGEIKAKRLSRLEITQAYLDRLESVEPSLNAFISVFAKEAIERAKNLDDKDDQGSLSGIPMGIKDLFCTKGYKTTAASKMLYNFIPPYNAEVVERLLGAGTVLLGKNNCDAWAHGASNENSQYGSVHNPWNLKKVPGGSSGGSAAAVAAGECSFSIGSDTGGSIRQPAGFCGVVGLKPTYGRISRYGLIAMASSLDVVGPITKNVTDSALLLSILAGKDKKDGTTFDQPVENYTKNLQSSLVGKKIGIPKEYFNLGLDPEVKHIFQEAIKTFEKLGAEIVDISLPHTEYGVAVYYIIQPAEVSSNLGRFDGIKYGYAAEGTKDLIDYYFKTRNEGFGEEAKRRIMLGTYVLSAGYYDAYYLKAQKVRQLIADDFKYSFERVDYILTPVSPTAAFNIEEKSQDPMAMYLADVFTVQPSLAGLPAISLPAGFNSAKLPVGIQIIGPQLAENIILNAAYQFEQETQKAEWRKNKTVV